MSARPHFNSPTAQVFDNAEEAARRGDRLTFDGCLHELESRKRGTELVEELMEIWEESQAPASAVVAVVPFQTAALRDFALLTDNGCHARLQMMRGARQSIWLSTYTLKDGRGELRHVLAECRRNGVDVNLVVSPGPVKPGGHAEEVVDDLRASGINVVLRRNHSKCVVVDNEYVMLGSSNLQDSIHRDVGVQFRSSAVATQLTEYLRDIVRQSK